MLANFETPAALSVPCPADVNLVPELCEAVASVIHALQGAQPWYLAKRLKCPTNRCICPTRAAIAGCADGVSATTECDHRTGGRWTKESSLPAFIMHGQDTQM